MWSSNRLVNLNCASFPCSSLKCVQVVACSQSPGQETCSSLPLLPKHFLPKLHETRQQLLHLVVLHCRNSGVSSASGCAQYPRVILMCIPQPYIQAQMRSTPAEDSLYRTCAPHHLISTAAHSHTPLTVFIDLHVYMYAACTIVHLALCILNLTIPYIKYKVRMSLFTYANAYLSCTDALLTELACVDKCRAMYNANVLVHCNGILTSTGVSAMRVHSLNRSCIMWRCNEVASLSCM